MTASPIEDFDILSDSSNSQNPTNISSLTPSDSSSPPPSPPPILSSDHLAIPTILLPSATMTTTMLGPNSLPILGQKGAPEKFRGRYDKVKTFIRHYEKLCALKAVTDAKDKIENITQYCSRNVREFMEGLPSYSQASWEIFAHDVLKFFDAERDARRYRVKDLESYVINTRSKSTFKNLATWKSYNRGFIRIAGWLVQKKKIDDEDRDLYFWKGIPKKFRLRVESRLVSRHPDHDMDSPWTMAEVSKVAESLLQRNNFAHERLPSDSESDASFSEVEMSDSEDSDSSSSDSDSDAGKPRKKKQEKKKSKKSSRVKVDVDSDDNPSKPEKTEPSSAKVRKPSTKQTNADQEMEDLIGQLSRMSVNDAQYAGLYYRACKLNPMAKEV